MAAQEALTQLKILFYSTPKVIKEYFAHPSEKLVRAISELALNLLNNPDLEQTAYDGIKTDIHKLKKYQKALLRLASRTEPVARKKQLLKIKGFRFVPLLLKFALPHVPRDGTSSTGPVEVAQGTNDEPEPTSQHRDISRHRIKHHHLARRNTKRVKARK